MYPYDSFIYTPPEITAREIKRELRAPASGNGVPSSKNTRVKLGIIYAAVITSPIWVTLGLMLLANSWFRG